ncbi:MAG: ATP12 family chaperone protein [Pikeienuella sp.]
MKRFYKLAAAQEAQGGWTVALDGKPIRTPARAGFLTPGRALAEAAAAEWMAQEREIKPASMPITRAVNTAIDRTGPEHAAVVEMVAGYGGSDLVSYRAEAPAELRRRQAEGWDPLIAWAEATHGAKLIATTGVMHALQPEDGQQRLRAAVAAHDAFRLTALYDLTALSGSLVIALAVAGGRLGVEEGWRLSRIDEIWQEEQWGHDEEAASLAALKYIDFNAAKVFLDLLDED